MINASLWILAIIVFLVLEAATSVLVSIWFAGGSLAALVAALCGAKAEVQIFVFLLISIVCIMLLRKAAVKSIHGKRKATNLDRVIGQQVEIIEAVDNKKRQGAVLINDIEWKVKSENGEVIPVGEIVTVTEIEGVKLVVKK